MRKLATAAVSFSAAVYAANYIVPFEWLLIPALVMAVTGAALFVVGKNRFLRVSIILLFFSLGFIFFYLHSNSTVTKAVQYHGQTHCVDAEILDYPEIYDDYCRLEVRVTSYYLPNLKAYLYDNDRKLVDVRPGDKVSLKAKLSSADTLYGEPYKGYHANGIYLKLSSKSDIDVKRGSFDLFTLPKHVAHFLSSRIGDIFPDDTEVFMRSLMLGDKEDFYGDEKLYVDMTRAGLMHIVAVSGMHVSYLVALLYHILGRGRRSALICISLVWFFALITGAGPSVVRASFMCSTMLMAPVLRRENDSITSLSTVLAALLALNPFAAASVSLQLSFAAMAGIVCIGGKLYGALVDKLNDLTRYKAARDIMFSVSSSLSVMAFTVPLTVAHFGLVALLSPITNLLTLWAVPICFCGGWISCMLSAIPFAGEISAWIISWLARYIFAIAEIVSSVPFGVIYAQTRGIWLWIGLCYVLALIVSLLKLGVILSSSIVGLGTLGLMALLIFFNSSFYNGRESVDVLDVGQGQCITVMTDQFTGIIDCGNVNTVKDAGTLAAAHLYSRGRDRVDFLLLSHLHEDHAGGAVMLMETIKVNTVILPSDYDDSDELYADIVNCAERNGVEILTISDNCYIECSDVEIELFKGGEFANDNERCLITKLKVGGMRLLLLADSTVRMQEKLVLEEKLDDIGAIVVSHHGSKYSCSEELLEAVGADTALISVGNNYYGHPAEETLEALKRWGYNIYRTDIDGNIEIVIGN